MSLVTLVLAALLFPTAARASSQFEVKFRDGAIVSLQRDHDPDPAQTDYVGRRLGDLVIKYRLPGGDWQSVQTANLAAAGAGTFSTNAEGSLSKAVYPITNQSATVLLLEVDFSVHDQDIVWTLKLQNKTGIPLEVGDLAIPMTVGARGGRGGFGGGSGTNAAAGGARREAAGPVVLKHSFISGSDSYMFWMRSDLIGPCLMLTTDDHTQLEYWEPGGRGGGAGGGGLGGGYEVFIHSAVAGASAREGGTKWRQPNTSLTLSPAGRPGDSATYGFKLQWAGDYEAVRKNLVDDGKVDVHVVPGMTVPADLFAEFALNTKHKITGVEAEFPQDTTIQSLGTKGPNRLYQVKFAKLGENRLAIHYGGGQVMYLEFFSTEPLETLIDKRANFIAHSQHRDPAKWYNGLISDRNMLTMSLLGPDNYDLLRGFRIYEVSCDDPGLCKPAFLAAKNADFPVQSEVEAMDYYLQHFVWGGLQRTTNETYSYGIYGIPDWKQNRDSTNTGPRGQLHIWREYDYPHVLVMYEAMYRVAQYHPEIKTALTAREYLERAYGTADAMVVVPHELDRGWEFNGTGFYNELVILDIIRELEDNGMQAQADKLRGYWEQKVRYFVNERANLFQSEYAFDTTGFESTEALAKYAVLHSDPRAAQALANVTPEKARAFLDKQMAANLFCRGWLTPAYYLLGSDIRGGGGNSYTLTYMSQMGGWSVLDYGLNFAANPVDYLRLGYASCLSSWALMNSGTPQSNYGYWFPGQDKDGGAGGGFEPAPFGQTWLGQAHHRGSWMYASEIDLGYCGALRAAATILADDPIFGRFCYGGEWRKTGKGLEVVPRDGVRRRLDAMLDNGKLSLILDNDHFAAARPITVKSDLSAADFTLESTYWLEHTVTLRLSASTSGQYIVRAGSSVVATVNLTSGLEAVVPLHMTKHFAFFTIARK
jgi:hypothetical protein